MHLSMFVALFLIENPNIDTANTLYNTYNTADPKGLNGGITGACLNEAIDWDFMITMCKATHIVMFVANSYREIFNAQTDMFGQFMRLVEVVCIPVYLYQVLKSIELLSIAMIRQESDAPEKNGYIIGDPS